MSAPCLLDVIAYGAPFRLVANTPERLTLAETCLPFGSSTTAPTPHARAFPLTADDPAALEALRRDLMVHVANLSPDFIFLHAGVVAWQGKGIVLPGPSFAGKTTLVAALVRAGATYYSDEYALIAEDGAIHPHARTLQMRQPGHDAQRGLDVSALGGQAAATPCRAARAALVAFCTFATDGLWAPQTVSPGMAVLEMLRHTIPVQRTPGRVMAGLAAMIAGADILQTQRGEADEAAAKLLARCGA